MNRDAILLEPFQHADVSYTARASAAQHKSDLQWFGFLSLRRRAERRQRKQAEQGNELFDFEQGDVLKVGELSGLHLFSRCKPDSSRDTALSVFFKRAPSFYGLFQNRY